MELPSRAEINEWEENVRKYHALGLWHATRYLSGFTVIKDPHSSAQDAVQMTWMALWKRQTFSKALFITSVLGFASNVVRDHRPVQLRKEAADRPSTERKNRWGRTVKIEGQQRTTSTFPVQIFGCFIGEVTSRDDIDSSKCGD